MKTLPLPSLDDTFATYLQWLRPLVDDKTYAHSAKALEDFRHLEAPKLQRLLEQRADLARAQAKIRGGGHLPRQGGRRGDQRARHRLRRRRYRQSVRRRAPRSG